MNGTKCVLLTACSIATAQEVYWRDQGVSNQSSRGWEVQRLGDVNGDGWEDLIEFAYGTHTSTTLWPEVWIVSGHDGTMLSWFGLNYPAASFHVAACGDMNANGSPDYAIAVRDQFINPTISVEVHDGGTNQLLWSQTVPNSFYVDYATAMAGEIDLDRDGRSDLLVGAPRLSPGGTIIAYGSAGQVLYSIVDPDPSIIIGVNIAPLRGDLDGDGTADFLVGCPDNTGRGAIAVFSGRTGQLLRISRGVQVGDDLRAAAACGDLDGDGVPDYAGGGYFGYVVTAFSGATGQPIWTHRNTFPGAMGYPLAGGFDLDQDGVNDLITGPAASAGARNDRVQVLSGRDGSVMYDFGTTGSTLSSEPGQAVAMLAPPPGERYPLFVYSEPDWMPPVSTAPFFLGAVWAMRGSPPGVRTFGSPDCTDPVPPRMGMLDLSGPTVRFSLSHASPSALTLLTFGWSNTAIAGVPLPLPLDNLGLPGMTVLTSADAALFGIAGADGSLRMDLPMPLTATGTSLFAQYLWLDPGDPSHHGSSVGHRLGLH